MWGVYGVVTWVPVLMLPLACCVTLGESPGLSETQCSAYFLGLF